jgi:N-acyl-D-glutamate deacylase
VHEIRARRGHGGLGRQPFRHGVTSQGKPHPRYYGTHAYVLGPCVRDLRLLTLEAAVAKMTGVAARALGLRDRGLLRPGAWADVAVFDRRGR